MTRKCEECDQCCIEAQVYEGEFLKSVGERCIYQLDSGKNRCIIFGIETRPKCCINYFCSWANGYGSEDDRPDKCGLIVSLNTFNNGTWIFARERKENAIETGKNIVLDIANKIDVPVIVTDFKTPLGQDYGDFTIIKKSLFSRCQKMIDEFIRFYDDEQNYAIFKLRK